MRNDRSRSGDKPPLSDDTVYEEMVPLEPYTTRELSDRLDASIGIVPSLLNDFVAEERVRMNEPEPNPRIWTRQPPTSECVNCGYQFQVRTVKPVLPSVHYSPRCGTPAE